MKFKDYIREMWPVLLTIFLSICCLNILFFVGLDENIKSTDVLYINGLCLMILAIGLVYHYRKVSKSYLAVLRRIKDKIGFEGELEKEINDFSIRVIRELEAYKNAEFQIKEVEYKEKLTNITEYISQVVHDLKVNLAVCEMISQRVPLEERDKLSYVLEQMKFRVDQVLYVARANHYSKDIRVEYFDIKDLLKRAIKDNAEFLMNKGIGISVEVESYEILNDSKWVLYILSQILNNSSKYTSQGGQINIVGYEDEKAYYIQIQDNGIGIAKEEIGRIFDKGFTGSNGRLNTKATGMGLYYAKKMANTLNIGLMVESKKDVYTCFTLAFYKHSDYMKVQEANV